MENTEQTVESSILNEEQLKEVVEPQTPSEETSSTDEVLPSDTPEFVMPDKFAGKSAEDIAKAYLELEKLKSKQEPTQEPEPIKEEPKIDPEYEAYKQEKQLKETLEPVGGLDKYKEAIDWAKDNLSASEVEAFNKAATSTTDTNTLQVLAKSLIDKHALATKEGFQPLHGNEMVKPPKVSGYETKSDMLKDMSDPRYAKDPSYRAKVEAKVAKTDESLWYASLPTH